MRRLLKILTGVTGLIALTVPAEAAKLGQEFVVASPALSSATAPLANGGFVVVWRGDDTNHSIRGQRYNSSGARVAGAFIVAGKAQQNAHPSVAALLDGGFAVAWDSTDVNGLGSFVQRYTAAGAKGSEGPVRANTFATGDQFEPTVAGLKNGTYVVLWTSNGQAGASSGVYGQRFSKVGNRVGAEFHVDTTDPTASHLSPTVAALTGGGFVAVFRGSHGTYARRFSATAGGIGNDVLVNPGNEGLLQHPVVAGLKDGGLVVVREVSTTTRDIRGQRYNASGVKVGPANFLVNKTTAGEQFDPAVAPLTNGGFVVVFADGTSTHTAFGRLYAASGAAVGNNIKLNTTAVPIDASPAVGPLANGAFVTTWQGSNPTGAFTIRGQRFDGH